MRSPLIVKVGPNPVGAVSQRLIPTGERSNPSRAIGAAGEAVASAFLCVRCFAGEGDAAGDSVGAGD